MDGRFSLQLIPRIDDGAAIQQALDEPGLSLAATRDVQQRFIVGPLVQVVDVDTLAVIHQNVLELFEIVVSQET